MSIEQFKGKEIAVFGMNSAGKSFVDFLNKNGIKTSILDEKNANYSDFKYEDLIEFVSRNDLKWNEIECLVVNYDDKALIELAEKKECQVFSILDFFEKYFSEYNYIGLVGESGISISCSLLKYFLYRNELHRDYDFSKVDTCFNINYFGNNKDYIVQLNQEAFNFIQNPHFNNLIIFDLDYNSSSLDKIQKMLLDQNDDDFAILNIDNKEIKELYKTIKDDESYKTTFIPISINKIIDNGVSFINNEFYINIDGKSEECLADRFESLDGEQNKINLLAIFALLTKRGYGSQEIIENFHSYKGIGNVFEIVSHRENIIFIDDIKNKNKSQALISFDNIYWILCVDEAEFEFEKFKELEEYFSKIKYVFLIGNYNENILDIFRENNVNYSIMYDMKDIFEKINILIKGEKREEKITILLSSINDIEENKLYDNFSEDFEILVNKE